MPKIKTKDGTELYVKDWGSGRPVILTHGWPLTADTWDDSAMVFADAGFRAIAYDRRGFGRSDQPWNGYDYDTFADDLADVIAATGAADATIIGFSMGGGEIARYLSRHGGKGVAQAGLISSVVPYMLKTDDNPNGVPQQAFAEMTEGMKTDRAHFFAGFFKDFYGVGIFDRSVSQEVLDWSVAQSMMAGLKPTLAAAKAFATTDFRPDLAAFTVPTLVIHGTADKTVPIDATAREVKKAVPNIAYHEYGGAPHGLFATNKDELTRDILAFLKG